MHYFFQIYFLNKTLHVSDSYSVHHQEFFTVHTTMVYVTQLASRIRMELSSILILLASCMTNTIAVCTVKKIPVDGQRNCPKHVEFYSKNKFEKLEQLVGKVIPFQARCGPEGGQRYSSTLP